MVDLLDKILFSNNTTTIQKFCANFGSVHFDEDQVREWITALITRKVEVLDLTVRFSVPQDLFTSESLTKLDLGWNFGGQYVRLDFPQSISLPKLKVLELLGVEFKDMASAQQFFSNCPVLEKMVLCLCSGKDVISFSAPNLKCFTLELSGNLKVEIDAPNLASIKFSGWGTSNLPVGSFPSLVKADFKYSGLDEILAPDSLPNFIRMYSNIKLLKASSEWIQILDIAKVSSSSFPTFVLMCLEVDRSDYIYSLPPISSLISFLHFSPNLESLIINLECYTPELYGDELTLNTTPHCLLLRLKSITIQNFKGFPSKEDIDESAEEMELVTWFLKRAEVLDQLVVIISSRSTISSTQITEELQSFPRASTHCNIKVSRQPT